MARLPAKRFLDSDSPAPDLEAERARYDSVMEQHYADMAERWGLGPSDPERFKHAPQMSEAKRRYLTHVHNRAKAAT
jgi:hypothetical protein